MLVYQQNEPTLNPISATERNELTTTSKYSFVNSKQVIHKMGDLGFLVESISYGDVKDKTREGTQKHVIIFNHPDFEVGGGDSMRALITNAHDGSSSLKFDLGYFRLVCANGLVFGDSVFHEKIRHVNISDASIEESIRKLQVAASQSMSEIARLKNRTLTQSENIEFLKNVAKRVYKKENSMLLAAPQREEDLGRGAWEVYNVLQESVIKGGGLLINKETHTNRRLRRITSETRKIEVNKIIYDEIVKIAA